MNKILLINMLLLISSFNCHKNNVDKYGFEQMYNKWLKRGVSFGYTSNPKIKFFTRNQNIVLQNYTKCEIIEDNNIYLNTIKSFITIDSIDLYCKNNDQSNPTITFQYSNVYSDGNGKFYSFFKIKGLNTIFFGFLTKDLDMRIKVDYFQLAD